MTSTILNPSGQTYGSSSRTKNGNMFHTWLITVSKPITLNQIGIVPSQIDSTTQKVYPIIYNANTGARIGRGQLTTKPLTTYAENLLPFDAPVYLVPGVIYAVGVYVGASGYSPQFYTTSVIINPNTFSFTDADGVVVQNNGQAVSFAGSNADALPPTSSRSTDAYPMTTKLVYDLTNYVPEVVLNDAGGEKTETFSVSYNLSDYEATLMSVTIKLNGVTLTTITNQASGAKTYSLPAATFNALPYGHKQTLTIEATDAGGKTGVGILLFKRILPANPPLVESVKAVNDAYSRMNAFKNELALLAEVPETSNFDEIIIGFQNSTAKKWAMGSVYVGMKNFPDGIMNIRGLDFTPSIILIREAGTSSFANSYVYAKMYKTATTFSNYLFGSNTSRVGTATPILFPDGFYFGPDAGADHNNFFDWLGLKTLEYIAIE